MLETPKNLSYLLGDNTKDITERNVKMDNQQESSREARLGWLGGIIDGEGTITLRRKDRKSRREENRILLTPTVSIVNTDEKIINNYVEILDSLEIPHWITKYPATDKWKARIKVEITGVRRCAKALPHIIPYLVGKQELGFLVYDWCKYRLETISNRSYYTDYDFQIYNKVKSFHGHQDEVNYIP